MTILIDYGVGNIFSLKSSFAMIDEEAKISSDPREIRNADRLVLPGVGAFGDAINKLRENGLDNLIIEVVKDGKPLLGICLGMQLLFERSFEYGEHTGLGLLRGEVKPLSDVILPELDIPHMGWNSLCKVGDSKLLSDTKEGEFVYFVHSFAAFDCDDSISAYSDYSIPVTAAVEKENVYGTQFHPEKSGDAGLKILRRFCKL